MKGTPLILHLLLLQWGVIKSWKVPLVMGWLKGCSGALLTDHVHLREDLLLQMLPFLACLLVGMGEAKSITHSLGTLLDMSSAVRGLWTPVLLPEALKLFFH